MPRMLRSNPRRNLFVDSELTSQSFASQKNTVGNENNKQVPTMNPLLAKQQHEVQNKQNKTKDMTRLPYRTSFLLDWAHITSLLPMETQTAISSATTTLPAVTLPRKFGLSFIHGSCNAQFRRNIRKSTMVVTSSIPNSPC